MSMEIRGGVPRVFRNAVPVVGLEHALESVSKFGQIWNTGANALRVYFRLEDFTADANFRELAATTGFLEGPLELSKIWFRAVGGATAVESIFYARRG